MKAEKDLVEAARQRSFSEEVERDMACFEKSIRTDAQAAAAPPITQGYGTICPLISQYDSSLLLRKIALLCAGSNLQIREGTLKGGPQEVVTASKQSVTPAENNELPISFYLTHGSRVVVDLPENSETKLLDWLTNRQASERFSATHSAERDKNGNLMERKSTFAEAAKHPLFYAIAAPVTAAAGFVVDTSRVSLSYHKGMNVAMYRPENEDFSLKADGSQGHVYFYSDPSYNPKTRGALLLGIEESAPGSAGHSLTGAANLVSATGGRRLEEIQALRDKPQRVVVPGKYNGMSIRLNNEQIDQLCSMTDEKIMSIDSSKLARIVPQSSLELLCDALSIEPPTHQKSMDYSSGVLKDDHPSRSRHSFAALEKDRKSKRAISAPATTKR